MGLLGKRSRFSRLAHAAALFTAAAAGVATLVALSPAVPAFASFYDYCSDTTNAQPTAVHQLPSASSPTIQFLNAGTGVNEGYCEYFNNLHEGHWYMTVRTTNGSNGGVGFIWVQRLVHGSGHNCYYHNAFGYEDEPIGSSLCPLYNYYGN
jgi:hypothetical protein